MMIRYFEDTMKNMRDIGGKVNSYGYNIATKKIIRSDLPNKLNPEQVNDLFKMNINNIIDLRNDEEILKRPNKLKNNENFIYHHIALGNGRLPDSFDDVYTSYIEMLNEKSSIKKIFEIIANSNNGILYHCSAGKDRTGIITMLILKILDVKDEDIIEDYVISGEFLKEELEEFAKTFDHDITNIIIPKSQTMKRILNYIHIDCNGIESFLNSCDVTKDSIKKIKNKYIIK